MTSSGPENVHAKMLLQTMCGFILPLIQTASGQTAKDLAQIPLGIEADEFISSLENFISDMISRAQSGNDKEIKTSIDVLLKNGDQDSKGLKDKPAPGSDSDASTSKNPKESPDPIPADNQSTTDLSSARLNLGLQVLHKYVTQEMPIRLLCFESHDSDSHLKISLLSRGGIFNHLAAKFRADFLAHKFSSWHNWISEQTRYGILSHTWCQTPGELTYSDWNKGLMSAEHPKCQKLINFCKIAYEEHGLTFGWIDTVCINKESSAELDESIRSMYTWYSKADICITYLAGTAKLMDTHNDPWFSRGWTLQELVAPRNRIKFYTTHWKQLIKSSYNDKHHPAILNIIRRATTITPEELRNIRNASISRRMQLAARRKVTREEDIAYCLMGIFDVSISTEYGEGAGRAFFRLVKEIFNSTKDVSDIFNWGGGHPSSSSQPITSLFPSSPSDYVTRSLNTQLHIWHPIKPLTLTHLGLRTPIVLMPAVSSHELVLDHQPIGGYSATVSVNPSLRQSDGATGFEMPKTFHLPEKVDDPEDWNTGFTEWSFGVLNVEGHGSSIRIPKACFAVLLKQQAPDGGVGVSPIRYKKVYTYDPIVFDLERSASGNTSDDGGHPHYYQIERSQLEKHGMQLLTLYL